MTTDRTAEAAELVRAVLAAELHARDGTEGVDGLDDDWSEVVELVAVGLAARTAGAVTVDDALGVLNRIHETDPTVLPALVHFRVLCNEQIADDPTVQVGVVRHSDGELYQLGLLGVLNGIFGVQPGTAAGWIAAKYDTHRNNLLGFVRNDRTSAEQARS